MTFLNLYKKYLSSGGNDVRGSLVKTFVDDVYSLAKTNPSYFEVRIDNSEELIPSIIVDDSKNEDLKVISLAPGYTLNRGSYIEWDNKIWIVLITDNQGDIYYRGRIALCAPEELKWIDEDGKFHSYPCVFHYGAKANFGTFSDKLMTLPDGRRQVVVQSNEHTRKIKRNKRFMFGGNVFHVIDHDFVSDDGIVNLNLKDDQYNSATDNLELGIADYYNFKSNYAIEILNGEYVTIEQSQHLQLSVKVFNNGEEIENPKVQYEVDDEAVAIVSEDGLVTPLGPGKVQASIIFEDIKKSIEINIVDYIVNNYTAEISGSDEIKLSLSKRYNVAFKNNGVPIYERAIFSLTDLNGNETNLASITSFDGSSCTIKAGTREIGWIILYVQSENGLIRSSKRIQIKPLL